VAFDLRSTLLPAVDIIRSIPGSSAFGLRRYQVFVRIRYWDGVDANQPNIPPRVGLGQLVDRETQLLVNGTNPRVRQITQREIVASGGVLTDQDIKIGPLTPDFPGGGILPATVSPPTSASATEIYWRVVGEAYPPGGAWFDLYARDVQPNFHMYLTLRANGKKPDG
jgi:hypothetical protein